MRYALIESPVGELIATAEDGHLTGLYFAGSVHSSWMGADWVRDNSLPVIRSAREQLAAYFGRELRAFELPLRLHGTPFQQRVWALLREVPFGATTSYGAMAAHLGSPGAARAVGGANGRNPVCIIVPCHRAIGASGELGGYSGGTERKRALLRIEGVLTRMRAAA